MTNISNFGDARSIYIEANYNHGSTPSDTNPNYNNPLEDFHWITNYGGSYTGWGSHWITGVTPLIHTSSTHLNQRSFAITYQDGLYQVDQIEAYYNHGYYSR